MSFSKGDVMCLELLSKELTLALGEVCMVGENLGQETRVKAEVGDTWEGAEGMQRRWPC